MEDGKPNEIKQEIKPVAPLKSEASSVSDSKGIKRQREETMGNNGYSPVKTEQQQGDLKRVKTGDTKPKLQIVLGS